MKFTDLHQLRQILFLLGVINNIDESIDNIRKEYPPWDSAKAAIKNQLLKRKDYLKLIDEILEGSY